MLKRCLFLISITLLAGCANLLHKNIQKPVYLHKIQQKRVLANFSTLIAKGKINIKLHTGYRRSQIIIKGYEQDIAHLHSDVNNGILNLFFDKHYPIYGKINVEIFTRRYNTIGFNGSGLIEGKNLNTGDLNLFVNNDKKTYLQGNLRLRRVVLKGGYTELIGVNTPGMYLKLTKARAKIVGKINLASLEVSENSLLSMYWVRSKSLTIRARKEATIQLAGIIDKLDLELWGKARFKGRFLRVEDAFIKTHDQSVAEIAAVKKQHTLASDTSDIRFYNIPTFKSDFMAFDGAVLDMRDLGSPFVQEYTQYNK